MPHTLQESYMPDFLSEAQERSLLDELSFSRQWKQVSGRRVQRQGGEILEKTGALLAQPLPR